MLDSQTVDTVPDGFDHPAETSLPAKIGWAALIVAALYVCYFSHLGAIGFVGPDEPRYAWVARDMMETGDWITPHLYGKPWFEKPPLYYWGAAVSFKLFGVNETAARLPSAISALLATLALTWLALRLYGAETARWFVLLLPTTVGMIGFSHAAATDMPFTGMLTIAIVAAAIVLGLTRNENTPILPRTPWLALLTFGFFLGLAVLTKGPAAIILSGGAVFFWALFTKRWRDAFRLLHPVAIAAFSFTALPWYILCARRNPDFFRVFIIEHNFKRYFTPEFQHIQPFWFYGPILIAAFLPWTLGFILQFQWDKVPSPKPGNELQINLFFLSFGLCPLLFFSVSQSKLPGYIMPAVPPLTCLLASRVACALQESSYRSRFGPILFGFTILAIGVVAMRHASKHILGQDILPAPWTMYVWLPLFISAVIAFISATRGRKKLATLAVHVGVLVSILGIGEGLVWMDPQISARGVVRATLIPLQSITSQMLYVYDLPRGIQYGLNFYLRRDIPRWSSEIDSPGYVFTSRKGLEKLGTIGYTCQQHIVFPAAFLCSKDPGILMNRLPRSGQPQ
jgi:4-amino-4-deoxy-L-arabinose transferase-like glycosyltransferase